MNTENELRTGWGARLAKLSFALLLFEGISGFAVTLSPFHAAVEWGLLLHTVAGVVLLLPVAWYCAVHWLDYKHFAMSHIVLLGYLALIGLVVCGASQPMME